MSRQSLRDLSGGIKSQDSGSLPLLGTSEAQYEKLRK